MGMREDVIEKLEKAMMLSEAANECGVVLGYGTVEDVIALLKTQEPRLVTIEDFGDADEFGWLPAWCEEYTGAVYCECILVDALKEKGIRHWTRRPTDEQREAIAWA